MKTQNTKIPSKIAGHASLKESRQRLGKTQAQIATEVGIKSYQAITQFESSRRPIPITQPRVDGNTNVLPLIKAIAECGISSPLSLKTLLRLFEYVAPLQDCSPVLIRAILNCGFK